MLECPGSYIARRLIAIAWLAVASVSAPPVLADGIGDLLPAEASDESASAERSIDVRTDAATDDDIRNRLVGIYGELESLDGIGISVSNGIVTLSGTVSTSEIDERASEIAAQVDGVIEVVDELSIDTNVGRRVESTMDRLRVTFGSLVSALPVLVLALLIIAVFWFIGRWVAARRGVFRAIAPNTFIAELLSLVTRIVVVFAGVILALTLLDATSIIGSVLGAAGIVGLALGFAVRDTVENFIASILLSLRTPFVARDYVRIDEHEGTVARLTSRATILISPDGNHLRVPNALVYKSVIVNYTRQPERRFEFVVGVDTDLDLNAAQQTALDTIYRVTGVLTEPAATVLVTELGDSNVSLTVRAWIDQRISDHLKVRSEAIRQVKQAFDDAGITMPEPIYRVRFQEGLLNIGSKQPAVSDESSPVDSRVVESASGRSVGTPARVGVEPQENRSDATGSEDKRMPDGSTLAAEVRDTAVDDSVSRGIARELANAESENLLQGESRTE